MANAYEQYQHLKARVDAFGQTIGQRYPTQITCHAGCDGCCYQQFTVFPVEAHHRDIHALCAPGARLL